MPLSMVTNHARLGMAALAVDDQEGKLTVEPAS
jgi:hypothetical protein